MSLNFFTIVWPLAFAIIILAGLIVTCAAFATLMAAITRARQLARELGGQTPDEEDPADRANHPHGRPSNRSGGRAPYRHGVVETVTTDNIHYTPVP